ncbi:MAG: S8 family serine peptidase [Steroidobacteraceae bacterium]
MRPLLALALLLGLIPPVHGAQETTDRIIVKWRSAAGEWLDDAAEARALRSRSGRAITLMRGLGGGMSLLRLDRPAAATELKATLNALRADPRVQLAEPDRRVHAHAYTPNDPLYSQQWYLKDGEISAIRADSAWDITHAGDTPATSPVVVAVIDTGVRFDHPDLARAADGGKLLPGYDFVSSDSWNGGQVYATANDNDGWDDDPSDPGDFISEEDLASGPFAGKGCGRDGSDTKPVPSSWHGTRVAGLIAANTDNAQGIAGTGFNLRVLPVRALGKCGGYDSDVIAAMYWAAGLAIPAPLLLVPPPVNQHPAQIINMSLGSTGSCSPQYAEAIRTLSQHGVLVVISAGNEGKAVDSPANCAGVVAVAGLRHSGTKVGYSNLGPEITLAAPAGNCVNLAGDCLYELTTTTNSGARGPTGYSFTTPQSPNIGTSFSAPLVAATAGMMKAVNPALTPAALTARLRATARPFPTGFPGVSACPASNPDDECICSTSVCGAGMLDAAAAVGEALRPTAAAQVNGVVGPARVLTLDGTGSGAAAGRNLVSYTWTVVSTAGGAVMPSISSANQASAAVESPTRGSYTLRLTIADNHGATDSADVTVTASGSTDSSNSPPAKSGGGGSNTPVSLLLLGMLLCILLRRRTIA